ncbi:MAG: hypothetical protein JXR48_03530 [Candidatus Delongbacteria bacterium]|nr:hypothetical protein [Candidatus Delongbacteria bacterium]MBN2834018.1 hypothetical protein [Candidatus Delongbacteria bacterium]
MRKILVLCTLMALVLSCNKKEKEQVAKEFKTELVKTISNDETSDSTAVIGVALDLDVDSKGNIYISLIINLQTLKSMIPMVILLM